MADTDSAATTTANTTTTTSPIPKSTVVGRWADEPDDIPDEPPSTSSDATADEVNLSSLAIDESKKLNNFLDDPEDSNIQAVTSGETPYTSAVRFEDLNLSPELLKGLYVEMKFERPSKIQSISLPMILTPPHKNLIAQAHNGSGKTTCFVLGMLSRVDPKLGVPQALCICPTRELAIQNMEVLLKMGKFTGITSELALPADKAHYIPISKRAPVTAQVIIGTPGTINKWIAAKKLGTSHLKILVFDEADHMLAESGFKEDSVRIMKEIVKWSPKCQVLLFSATFNDVVKAFVSKIVKDLFVHEYNQLFVKKEELSLDSVKQYKVNLPDELSKIMVIKDKIMDFGEKIGQTIIFVRSKKSAAMLHEELVKYGFEVTTIHGNLIQEDRDKIVKEFKDGLTHVLISTDVLARGFDQSQVNLVVNYDLPVVYNSPEEPDYEVYLHRIGRAGRFGRKGAVFNLLCGERDDRIMEKIEKHFNHYVSKVRSWESDEDFKDALQKAGLM
ncbi:DEAD-box ATP-dependent RNA helicase 38 [Rutidosis leptorrhynchoides]|uniref:DEAD-box ATP-dependent RNA helicase 38 n=1 Tax=Rutidosis leptorrhynchoides TaxID=125765 RepID=UPI003A9A4A02